MKLKFSIPGNPITKKNSQRMVNVHGRVIPMPSKQFVAYQKDAEKYIPYKWYNINVPCNIKCIYYMPTKRRVDLCNLLAATCDILVHYGVIEDDNCGIAYSHDGSCVVLGCKDNPRVEIEITEIGE